MTEESWYSSTDAVAMLGHKVQMRSRVSGSSTLPQPRKSRLYFVACAHRVWDTLPRPVQVLVRVAEELADEPGSRTHAFREEVRGLATALHNTPLEDAEERLVAVGRRLAELGYPEAEGPSPPLPKKFGEWLGMNYLAFAPLHPDRPMFEWVPQAVHSAQFVRDIFDPFRRVSFSMDWKTTTVQDLARTIYRDRAFHMMPILADALQDAGCPIDRILDHCRGSGPHVRGCWVLDMILGKRS